MTSGDGCRLPITIRPSHTFLNNAMVAPMHEYTLSLGIWIVPIVVISVFLFSRRLLAPEKIFALGATICIMAAIGFVLDLLFAHAFFTFPNPAMVCGWKISGIPIEEFVFYVTGFWFIVLLYVVCDEWLLRKYNVRDEVYARHRAHIMHLVLIHKKSIVAFVALVAAGIGAKSVLNPTPPAVPGYFIFLTAVAYVPSILFFRATKSFVNWRAVVFSVQLTMLLSIIWEVTLALPRGYWGYQSQHMLGVFIPVWNGLPLEAVTVWIFSALSILVYEFVKICYFTPTPTVPGHRFLLKLGPEWRNAHRPGDEASPSDSGGLSASTTTSYL